ncbi:MULTISPECIES: hypothetical protein [Bradyrhizobium]|uniref:hypothetical protein n=1 Tax=Bradyrhizobium TaxID=374 RepID=UPI0011416275|nr:MULTISPECIES: hypothetical protein [Bradyrhizobium]UFW51255.1 hypothetical protein BaraCB756_09670 [Bradyrhizobium arachidis]
MRESSHFDGHQTTGYTLPKNITKLEGFGIELSHACQRVGFPGRHWEGPHKRWYVDGLSIRGGVGFAGDDGAHPNCCLGFDCAAQL